MLVVHGKNGVKPVPCKVRLLVLCMVLKKYHLPLHGAHLLLFTYFCVWCYLLLHGAQNVSPTSAKSVGFSSNLCTASISNFCFRLQVLASLLRSPLA